MNEAKVLDVDPETPAIVYDVKDGVVYITINTDVVVTYKGKRTELVAKDQVTAIGGDVVSTSGGSFHFNPYDIALIDEKYRGVVSDEVLHDMMEMAYDRMRTERKAARDAERKQFYWQAAQNRKFGSHRLTKSKCGCHV